MPAPRQHPAHNRVPCHEVVPQRLVARLRAINPATLRASPGALQRVFAP